MTWTTAGKKQLGIFKSEELSMPPLLGQQKLEIFLTESSVEHMFLIWGPIPVINAQEEPNVAHQKKPHPSQFLNSSQENYQNLQQN